MTVVFAGQVSVTTTAVNLATAFPSAPANVKRLVFSAESTTTVRVQVQAAKFSNAIMREINPSAAAGFIDEHVIDGDGDYVYLADYSVATGSGSGKINVYGLG
jgi:hypothetical protein